MIFKLFNVIDERDSKFNGKLQVVRDLNGTRIISGGVSQSGWLVKKVWEGAIKKILKDKRRVGKILILGLGGGSSAELTEKYWPGAKKIGVDIDSEIVLLGKKYLQLGKLNNFEIVIVDAIEFIDKSLKLKNDKYDIILVDLFTGGIIPAKFYKRTFIHKLSKLLDENGVVAFNHLYTNYNKDGEISEKEKAFALLQVLRKKFTKITSVTPEANIIFLCFSK